MRDAAQMRQSAGQGITLAHPALRRVNASKRSTELYADEDKAAEWTKSKEARGDWWHALDTTNRHVFGEDSVQKTWAGVDRGTEQSYKGAKEFAR